MMEQLIAALSPMTIWWLAALVTEEINNLQESGAIRLDGVIWTARSESGEVIPAGTTITVKRIAGVKAYVEPAKVPAEV